MQDVSSTSLPELSPRHAESHKGDYGRVLIIGGSRGMAGAPALAGKSALRSGAGLVTLAVPHSIQSTVAGFEASYMTVGLGSEDEDSLAARHDGDILKIADRMNAIALGPGLGTAPETMELVADLYENLSQPLIVDADALNALAQHEESLSSPGGPRILTPHPGEFERLTGMQCDPDVAQRVTQAAILCKQDTQEQIVVVLKGHRTIVTDAKQYSINSTGNPGMATGGTGDCLTGILTALVAQGLSIWDAARFGVYVHGLAGDMAADELGQVSLIASDLIDYLPEALSEKDIREPFCP